MTARMWRALGVLAVLALIVALVRGAYSGDVPHALTLLLVCAIGEQTARRP